MLRLITPVSLTSIVDVTVNARYPSVPISTMSANHQTRLAKPFVLSRSSSFRFTSLTSPGTIVIEEVVTSIQPIVDLENLENFSRVPNDMLRLLRSAVRLGQSSYDQVADINMRLTLAIENFDVPAFLQARFEILRMSRKFATKIKPESAAKKRFFVPRQWQHLRIVPSYRLGLKIDGKETNSILDSSISGNNTMK